MNKKRDKLEKKNIIIKIQKYNEKLGVERVKTSNLKITSFLHF